MPEFVIRDGLRQGLRDSPDHERNSERLVECYNAKPARYGIMQHYPVTYPSALAASIASAGITVAHPFPQIFCGQEDTLLFSETKVYSVNETTWALTELALKQKDSSSSATIASGGGVWQFADMGKAWWAFNGVTTVFYAKVGGTWQYKVDTSVPTQTGCCFKGRAIFGGFSSSNYWSSTWTDNIEAYTANFIKNPGGITISGIGSNFVSWSSIGGGDVMAMLYPSLMQDGAEEYLADGHSSTKPIWFDYLERNECGFMPMPWRGSVWCVKPLGKSVIVYGDNGIAALTPVLDPIPTMGMVQIAKFGLASRTAVGGDENGHVFVDSDGSAWYIGTDLTPKRLDYSNVLSEILGDSITVVSDEQRGEFHITGTTPGGTRRAITRTESGFYTHRHPVTSGYLLNGSVVGIYESLADTSVSVRTDTIDFDSRDIKTIHTLIVGGTSTEGLLCRIYFRSDSSSSWADTGLLYLNSKGVIDALVSGVEFQVQIYTDDYTNIERIDYIKLLWREQGVRNFRRSVQG